MFVGCPNFLVSVQMLPKAPRIPTTRILKILRVCHVYCEPTTNNARINFYVFFCFVFKDTLPSQPKRKTSFFSISKWWSGWVWLPGVGIPFSIYKLGTVHIPASIFLSLSLSLPLSLFLSEEHDRNWGNAFHIDRHFFQWIPTPSSFMDPIAAFSRAPFPLAHPFFLLHGRPFFYRVFQHARVSFLSSFPKKTQKRGEK